MVLYKTPNLKMILLNVFQDRILPHDIEDVLNILVQKHYLMNKEQFLNYYKNDINQFWRDVASLGFKRDEKKEIAESDEMNGLEECSEDNDNDFNIDDFFDSDEFKKRSEAEDTEIDAFKRNVSLIKDYQGINNSDERKNEKLNDICKINQRLVEKIARKYEKMVRGTCLNIDDLIAFGNYGLLKAIDKFVPDMGYQFSTYATWWIRQSMTRGIADESRVIRLPVHLHEKIMKIKNEERLYKNEFGLIDERKLCKDINMNVDEYWRFKSIAYQFDQITHLETIVGVEGDTELQDLLSITMTVGSISDPPDYMLTPEELFEKKELHDELENTLECLTSREAEVIKLRFGINKPDTMTLEEVGEIFHVTRERIRQIEAKALKKLRHQSKSKKLKEFTKG
ncbi:sigma-70 family RNA polymerase sigma factor [Sporolactobacillus laevolacticus]|uniref:sigma-70 family RNA polymerase sigma factor n=1 Tax=Sporolactobacillus laevolacticus TaxID=33018 RepID=UPI0025B2B007|nr:sigma-70 family RNA polymerase sigma factor [Sporolactobacillus laevolacticus]MDN3956804.1 sigma-70 family RNA polymerase sigma factor [Sporolactobacillus laevolacticus]